MDPIELLRGIRNDQIIWDHNSYAKPHTSHYPTITFKQLSMIVRPYPSGWTAPKNRQWLWLPSATLLKQVADLAPHNQRKNEELGPAKLNQPELPPRKILVRPVLPKPTRINPASTRRTTTVPAVARAPADIQAEYVEYTPSFKPLKRRISLIPPESLN